MLSPLRRIYLNQCMWCKVVISVNVTGMDKTLSGLVGDFALDADKETLRAGYEMVDVLAEGTPVDAVEARDNWNIAVGSPDLSVIVGIKGKSYRGRPKTGLYRGESSPPSLEQEPYFKEYPIIDFRTIKGQNVFVTNSNDYIAELDEGTLSKQAPQGIVDVAVQGFV